MVASLINIYFLFYKRPDVCTNRDAPIEAAIFVWSPRRYSVDTLFYFFLEKIFFWQYWILFENISTILYHKPWFLSLQEIEACSHNSFLSNLKLWQEFGPGHWSRCFNISGVKTINLLNVSEGRYSWDQMITLIFLGIFLRLRTCASKQLFTGVGHWWRIRGPPPVLLCEHSYWGESI